MLQSLPIRRTTGLTFGLHPEVSKKLWDMLEAIAAICEPNEKL
jgi:hypothetical protein